MKYQKIILDVAAEVPNLVEVRLFNIPTEMLSAVKRFTKGRYPNIDNAAAYCEATPDLMPDRKSLSVVFFNREEWTEGMIAHEFLHVANAALRHFHDMRQISLSGALTMGTPSEEKQCDYLEAILDHW